MKSYFPTVLGNKNTRERIGKAALSGTLPHALLITGPQGSGKSKLATEISAALNCENKENDTLPLPCGECSCCKRIYDGNFPDIKSLSRSKDRATIGVDAIKDFREDMFLSSTESQYKIYIIDDAERMTTEAQNALLKVLEEPPESVVILLLAKEADKILTTIKSRAQQICPERFSREELISHLRALSSEAERLFISDRKKLDEIVMSSGGVIGAALGLLSSDKADESIVMRREIDEVVRCIAEKHTYLEIHAALSKLPSKRAELLDSLELVISATRDIIAAKSADGCATVFYPSADEALAASPTSNVKRLISVYGEIMKAHERISKNAGVANVIAALSAKLKFI